MAIPDYQTVMLPLLRLAAVAPVSMRDARAALGAELGLSVEEQGRMLPKVKATVFQSRVGWAKTYLKQAGLVAQPARAIIAITPRGRDALAANPVKIDSELLGQFSEFRNFLDRSRLGKTPDPTGEPAVPVRAGARERLGKSGDGGVDGLVREDELGLDRLYIKAKRYQPTNKVGVDTIRSFAGALDDHGADKGIMITTSSFSPDAIAYTKRNQRKRIILIDGEVLADLMIRFNVGVRLQRAFEMKRIDQDYFDEAEAD